MLFQIRKISDEGSSEPFYARLLITISALRNQVLKSIHRKSDIEEPRLRFDRAYQPVVDAMQACRTAKKSIIELVSSHRKKVETGEIIEFQQKAFFIQESIDGDLSQNISKFLVNGVIVVKGLQKVTKQFGIPIGFLFQKDTNFRKGLNAYREAGHNDFAEYMNSVRSVWMKRFIQKRNDLEHEGWVLPDCRYQLLNTGEVRFIEPAVDGIPVSSYVEKHLNRILSFVENVLIYTFQVNLKSPLTITEILTEHRDPRKPERFRLNLLVQGIEPWTIEFSDNDFA